MPESEDPRILSREDHTQQLSVVADVGGQFSGRESHAAFLLIEGHDLAQRERIATLEARDLALRRKIHLTERHNQYFERCESGWCNPVGTIAAGYEKDEAAEPPVGDPFAVAVRIEVEKQVAKLEADNRRLREKVEAFADCTNWVTVPGAGKTGTDYACAWIGPGGPYAPDFFARGALQPAAPQLSGEAGYTTPREVK